MTRRYTDAMIEACAHAAHEANRAYCREGHDDTHLPWDLAPEWQRHSARLGVIGVFDGNTPEQSHQGWLAEKLRTGWKYGPVKDPEAREHPCMLPYENLPQHQKVKDHLYVSVVRAMFAAFEQRDTTR